LYTLLIIKSRRLLPRENEKCAKETKRDGKKIVQE
jgi:chromatin segregation and condensation protein Rec8/ScpA/Scc1 (kleisin family)